jgi:hypothetical protein
VSPESDAHCIFQRILSSFGDVGRFQQSFVEPEGLGRVRSQVNVMRSCAGDALRALSSVSKMRRSRQKCAIHVQFWLLRAAVWINVSSYTASGTRFMRKYALAKGVVALAVGLAAIPAWAATIVVTFPELANPPSHSAQNPFPVLQPLPVGTVTFPVPSGERVVAAQISGFWGSSLIPEGTAGVDVRVDGVLVAQCVKPASGCWEPAAGQRPWSHEFTESELSVLNDGVADMTALQTSDITVRLGTSTLIVQTGPLPPVIVEPTLLPAVPALSSLGLLALIAGLAVAGAFVVRRTTR